MQHTRSSLVVPLDDLRRFGSQTAVVRYTGNRRRTTTYAETARLAGRFAAYLEARDITQGNRVLLWAENSAEWIAAFYGCMMRGVIAVPLDAYGTPDFAARIAADIRPSLIVGDSNLLATLPDTWPKLAFEDLAAALPREEAGPIPSLTHDTPLQILFTSGTTGDPKGIVHTHGNVLASIEPIAEAARNYQRYARLVHPLRFLHTLPLSHVFGQTMGLWIPPIFAAEVHFESRLTASRLIETIRRERISVLASVPRILAMIKTHLEAEYPGLPERLAAAQGVPVWKRWWLFRDIHSAFGLKFWAFITGGGALPEPVEQFWNALGFVLVQGYGMTETAALITLNHPFKVARGTLGKPLPGREVKLGLDGEVLVRGPMISPATWSAGALHRRSEDWLATGDLARADPTGELRFIGRKSETIVTAAGVNIHPEDLEAALEQQPEVAACAVVPVQTASGPEPCAVFVLRGSAEKASVVIQRANASLADFQRLRSWTIYPEPDLPRTSTGKVKRAAVAAWLVEHKAAAASGSHAPHADWLLQIIANITGDSSDACPDAGLRLSEDLRLDSLGRVQLLESLEHHLGVSIDQDQYDRIETLGQLRSLIASSRSRQDLQAAQSTPTHQAEPSMLEDIPARFPPPTEPENPPVSPARQTASSFVYPRWPWVLPIRWLRAAFVEIVMRPLVWLLAAPGVELAGPLEPAYTSEPLLIIANHITSFDVPLLLYALPRALRHRTAVAMSGEMLEDFRHARNLRPPLLNPLGPPAWLLMTALFNVFPLPRQRDFQRSFAHAGRALDHGLHVIVFPEGTRSPEGNLAAFRPGIGMLVKQSHAAVLPMALVGLGDLKLHKRRWFRPGTIAIRVGQPMRFAPTETDAAIASQLHHVVQSLLSVR